MIRALFDLFFSGNLPQNPPDLYADSKILTVWSRVC